MGFVLARALADYLNPSVDQDNYRCARRWLFCPKRGRVTLWDVCNALMPDAPEKLLKKVQHHARTGQWQPKAVLFRVER